MDSNKITKDGKTNQKRSTDEKMAYCKAWESSGLSRSAFCKREGLSLPTLCSWLKRKSPLKKSSSTSLQFMPVEMLMSRTKEEQILEIKLPNGLQCRFPRIVDIKQICEVVEDLQNVTTN